MDDGEKALTEAEAEAEGMAALLKMAVISHFLHKVLVGASLGFSLIPLVILIVWLLWWP